MLCTCRPKADKPLQLGPAHAPCHCTLQAFVRLDEAPEVRDAHALDGGLHFIRVRVFAFAVPVLGKVHNVRKSEATSLAPAFRLKQCPHRDDPRCAAGNGCCVYIQCNHSCAQHLHGLPAVQS